MANGMAPRQAMTWEFPIPSTVSYNNFVEHNLMISHCVVSFLPPISSSPHHDLIYLMSSPG